MGTCVAFLPWYKFLLIPPPFLNITVARPPVDFGHTASLSVNRSTAPIAVTSSNPKGGTNETLTHVVATDDNHWPKLSADVGSGERGDLLADERMSRLPRIDAGDCRTVARERPLEGRSGLF